MQRPRASSTRKVRESVVGRRESVERSASTSSSPEVARRPSRRRSFFRLFTLREANAAAAAANDGLANAASAPVLAQAPYTHSSHPHLFPGVLTNSPLYHNTITPAVHSTLDMFIRFSLR